MLLVREPHLENRSFSLLCQGLSSEKTVRRETIGSDAPAIAGSGAYGIDSRERLLEIRGEAHGCAGVGPLKMGHSCLLSRDDDGLRIERRFPGT